MTSSAEVPSGPAPLHSDEDKRLALLRELNLPAPAMTSALDAIARMARRQTGCTIGAVCVIDAQWHKVLSASGAEPIDQPRSKSFCETTIAQTDLLEITDAIGDTRWAGTAASQQASSLRFYAGVAIRVEGLAVGTVCVFDTQARRLEGAQRDALHDLAALAATVFHERLREMRVYAHDELMRAASRAGSDWLWETDADGVLTWVSDSVEAHTGWPASAEIGMHSMKLNRPPKLPEARASWDRYRAARAAREPFRDGIAERDSAHGPILVAMSGKPFFDADGVYRGYRGAARDVTAEVNEREQVQRLQSLLQQAIEAINAGVMISGPDGRVLIGNAAWRRDLAPYSTGGYERWEDIIRAMVDAGLYPAAVGREDEFVAWRLSLPSLDAKPQEFQLRDGSFLVTDQLLPDGSVIHLSLNVTELRRAEREVERQRADALASQARMEAVLRAVPDLWIVFDADNRYLYCSDDRHPWLAQPFDRMRGRLIGEIVPPPVAELCVDAIERARSSGEVQHIEYQLDTLGSQRRSFEARLSPMPGRQVLLLTRDVTERLRAALSLAEAEERWKFAIEGAGDGVWDLDLDKNQAFMSPIWKAMIGFEVEPETGPSLNQWVACIHPDDRDRVLEAMWRYRRGSISDYRIEYRVRHKEGHWIWVLDRGKIVERRADGEPLRIVGTHTDITRLKLAEQALRDKQATELASRAKSEFLSRMSHEMRTPLNAVIGFAQLLRLQPDNSAEKVAEYTDHVLRAAEHLLGLVNEVLDLQRFEDGRATLTTEPVELAPFIDATLELLRPMAHGSSVALNNQVPPGIWVQADPRGLRQVLVNLCSNAIKYNRPNGWVCIGLLDAAQGRVALAIEDTGSGLTDTQITRLFQPFERLGHETSGIEGSGLGLLIARTLVIEMGGELTLSSIKDAGTLARVELPAASAQATDVSITPASVPEPAAATSAQSPLRVLYVEDNRINALLFEEAMRVLGGFDLKVAEDGAQALALVAQWTPQVLVLDAHLPDMTGFEVLQRLRELPALAQVPAYMCSADAMAEDLQRARDAGFTGYWTKPIEVAVVSADLDALRQTANP